MSANMVYCIMTRTKHTTTSHAAISAGGRLVIDIPDDVVILAVTEAVCGAFGITAEAMVGTRRFPELVDARRAICVMLDDLGYKMSTICKAIGRDRTTVYHFVKTGRALREHDYDFRCRIGAAMQADKMA